jgi:hypothetical protein
LQRQGGDGSGLTIVSRSENLASFHIHRFISQKPSRLTKK